MWLLWLQHTWLLVNQLQILLAEAYYKIIESNVPCALSLAPGSVSVTVSLTVMGSSKSMIYKINIVNAGYYGE